MSNMTTVFSETTKYPIDKHFGQKQTAQRRKFVKVGPGKVGFFEAYYLTGKSRRQNHRWWRWETSSVQIAYLTKTGQIAGFVKIGKRWHSEIPFTPLTTPKDAPYLEDVEEALGGIHSFKSVFPAAESWGITCQQEIPEGLATAMRQPDLPSFTKAAYGKTRYRRDLAKAVANANIHAVGLARDFRGLVPIDWIIHFLRQHEIHERNRVGVDRRIKSIRPVLFTIDQRSLRDLLFAPQITGWKWQVADIGTFISQNQGTLHGRYRTWEELHDASLRALDRTYIPPKNMRKDIPLTALGSSLDSLDIGEYKIVIPKTVYELYEWGNYMHNCIGSYASRVNYDNSGTTLGGVYRNSDLLANFEITNGSLRQFLGKYNRSVPADFRQQFEQVISSKGISVKGYWGEDDQ